MNLRRSTVDLPLGGLMNLRRSIVDLHLRGYRNLRGFIIDRTQPNGKLSWPQIKQSEQRQGQGHVTMGATIP